ncbi:hypothetical protein CHUAL_014265 [Chamberlinius hualienensis]
MKSVEPAKDKKRDLTFRDAVDCVVKMHFFYGMDIRKTRNRFNFICNVLFLFHLISGFLFFAYANLKAELQSENIQVFLFSAGLITLSFQNIVMKITYRWSNAYLVDALDKTDFILDQFQCKEKPLFMKKLQRLSRLSFILPLSFITVHSIRLIEFYWLKERLVDYGPPLFIELNEKYHIEDIFRLGIAYHCQVFFVNATMLMIPLYFSSRFTFNQLKLITDVHKYIELHRHLCEYFIKLQQAFGLFFFCACATILIVILFFARTVATSSENISMSAILLLLVYFPILIAHIVIIARINNNMDSTTNHLLIQGNRMKCGTTAITKSQRLNMLTKLELYKVFVSFEDPCLKLIGVGRVKPHIVIAIVDFVLCYVFVLYKK